MIKKKGLIIEALIRTIITIFLVVIVLNIGKNAGEAAGLWGISQSIKSLENLANKLNSPDLKDGDSRQELIDLEQGDAIIGFSKDSKQLRCYGCQQIYGAAFSGSLLYYTITKPLNKECDNKACVCVCSKEFVKTSLSGEETKITCGSFSCRTLEHDIAQKITLETALKKKNIQIATYPYWENGFFFVRRKNADTPLNGMMPPPDAITTALYIEKKLINQKIFIAACPDLPCIA